MYQLAWNAPAQALAHGTVMIRSPAPFLALCLFAVSVGFAGPAWAGPAETAVKQMQRAAETDDVDTLDRHVDYGGIARASLDRHWSELTESEQSTFVGHFKTIVRRAYRKGLSGKKKHELQFKGESESPRGSLVHTLVKVKPGEPELAIDYLMTCSKGDCRLIDVVTDGSSLVASWKRMFRRIIKRHGKAELLSRIEKKAQSET